MIRAVIYARYSSELQARLEKHTFNFNSPINPSVSLFAARSMFFGKDMKWGRLITSR